MLLHVHASSGVPIYQQITAQVKHAVASGALSPGDALPSVRKLAAELRINPNTIARAYQELESEGVTRSVPGGGTYVAESRPGLLKTEKVRRLRPLARQLAVESTQLRYTESDCTELLHTEFNQLGEKQ
jgi:GntR family transcriptional regulator